jgi:hypothetical protein
LKKAEELSDEHWTAWHVAVNLTFHHRSYDRGVLANVLVFTDILAEDAAAVLAREPATFTLRLRRNWVPPATRYTPVYADKLATNPHLKAVTRVAGSTCSWRAKDFARLLQSPHLGNLKQIDLVEVEIGLAGVKAIVESPSPFVLERLDLRASLQKEDRAEKPNTLRAVELIASSPRFASLEHLKLSRNGLGAKSAKALLASKTLPRTLVLEVEDNPCEEEYREALAERFTGVSDGDDKKYGD